MVIITFNPTYARTCGRPWNKSWTFSARGATVIPAGSSCSTCHTCTCRECTGSLVARWVQCSAVGWWVQCTVGGGCTGSLAARWAQCSGVVGIVRPNN